MSATPAMLGGVAATAIAKEDRRTIATSWAAKEAHDHYRIRYPGLRLQAPAKTVSFQSRDTV
jgi:hypothetical protein